MKTCTECGKEFVVLNPLSWTYRSNSVCVTGQNAKTKYQCSYTCYDHAKLSTENKLARIPTSMLREYVEKSERNMQLQGKTILNPIQLKKTKGKYKDKFRGLE